MNTSTRTDDRMITLLDGRLEAVRLGTLPVHLRWAPTLEATSHSPGGVKHGGKHGRATWPTLCGVESDAHLALTARTVGQRALCRSCLRVLRTQGPGVAVYSDELTGQAKSGDA